MRATLCWLVFLCVLVCQSALAEQLVGDVVAVEDGDTLTVLDADLIKHRVRLNGIDAPEKKQPFTEPSKASLVELTLNRRVVVEWRKKDRHKRLIGKIVVDGQDVCLEQIRRGMAWYYRDYASDVAAGDRPLYLSAEAEARKARRGLWSKDRAIPPQEWRRGKR